MKNVIALILVATLTSGCVAMTRTPPESVVSRLKVIAIVPVEAPPLLLHPDTEADRANMAKLGLTSPEGGSSGTAYLTLPIFCPLCVATSLPLSIAISSIPRPSDTVVMTREQPPQWMPTAGLARIAARLLQRPGSRETFVADGYALLPIADRSVNVFLENWMAPVRRWYNSDEFILEYSQPTPPQSDATLEIGILNYEYFSDILLMQVMVKLSDPTTKRVLGRARNWVTSRGKSLAEMLQDQGQPLRRLIETNGEASLAECLKNLGLLPHSTLPE